jgi:transposase
LVISARHSLAPVVLVDAAGDHADRAIFVAEIGDISRFDSPKKLCSWAGLTPKHRESDEKVTRGRITKQGCPLVRWAAIEAVSKYRGGEKLRADYFQIREHAGKFKARVAVA